MGQSVLDLLCDPVRTWFESSFSAPTDAQVQAWPAIAEGGDVLLAAPTGSGKTLSAFLMILDRLARRGRAGTLEDAVDTIYVSPLRALSVDIHKNLELPLLGILAEAERCGHAIPGIRSAVRTGDTAMKDRAAHLREPPQILITTPESLFLLVTAKKSAEMLRTVRTIIVDEIHALLRDKRGAHLSLTLERLSALANVRPQRIGLSATQRPMDRVATWLCGAETQKPCTVIDLGHARKLDLQVVIPEADDLASVASNEQWDDLQQRLVALIEAHRTTLIFANTRRLAERLAHRLQEKLGADSVAAHHGSLSKERRGLIETRLKTGELKALVATASLELGIDVGHIDLVCQIGSPRSISGLLQRVGRSGHALGLVPKGRILATTRDELLEAAALIHAVKSGHLDRLPEPKVARDILAQQVVAQCADESVSEDELFALVRRSAAFAELDRADFDAVLEMLDVGFETPKGRRGQLVHRDRIHGMVRGRRGARLAALTSGGAIPELGDYKVVLDPDEVFLGTVNEDFAIESMAGDIFLLGTQSWKIRRVESGVVRVVDAHGAPPTVPFWLGEAPGRSLELSAEVGRLRASIAERLDSATAENFLIEVCGLSAEGARQAAHYVRAQLVATGVIPTQTDILFERFFDESGGMQLVVHAPFGARINRGFGLALRKRFCRAFNQELQAAATDDAVVLSLGQPQTFDLAEVPRWLHSKSIREVLEQAVLAAPGFRARFRWNAQRSLCILRFLGGKPVPFAFQRMQADDLLGAAFPEQTACQEHVTYPVVIPDNPLVKQTVEDCLFELADLSGLTQVLSGLESGTIRAHVRDTVEPSPFAHEVLGARPYAFLDDAPLEERRTRAVSLRRVLPETAEDLTALDPAVIDSVREELAPSPRHADEAHEWLLDAVVLPRAELPFFDELRAAGRAAPVAFAPELVAATERARDVEALYGTSAAEALLGLLPPALDSGPVEFDTACEDAVRGQLLGLGPADAARIAERIGLPTDRIAEAFVRLEVRGIVLRGHFDPRLSHQQACIRHLLARIHARTLDRLRRAVAPVSAQDYLRFLFRWQHLHPETRLQGEEGLRLILAKLSGYVAPFAAFERELLRPRMLDYRPRLLDSLALTGRVGWARLLNQGEDGVSAPHRRTSITIFPREDREALLYPRTVETPLRGPGARLQEVLQTRGALFVDELQAATRLLPSEIDEGLKELLGRGLISCDGFGPLRVLLGRPRRGRRERERGRESPLRLAVGGRWHLLSQTTTMDDEARAEAAAMRHLRRYGVVLREVVLHEGSLVPYREVRRALRRLEVRGQVRGGRFVAGFSGEQFALPEAIVGLRTERERKRTGERIQVAASDPANLLGVLTPDPKIRDRHGKVLTFVDGAWIEETMLSVLEGRST